MAENLAAKPAAEALHESETRYRGIFDSAPISIWEEDFIDVLPVLEELKGLGVQDFRGYFARHPELVTELVGKVKIVDVNQPTLAMFGARDKAELLASLHLIFLPETESVFAEELVALAEGRTGFKAETGLRTLHGERRDVLFTMALPPAGAGSRVLVTLMDISDRKRTEQALRESELRYRAVVESQLEMVCRFRLDGTILFVNEAYARAAGTTAPELIHRSFWSLIPEPDRTGVRAMLDRLTPEAPEVRIENRFNTARGERWTLWTNRALAFDAAGRPLEAQSTGIDITDRRRAEEALRASDRQKVDYLEGLLEGFVAYDENWVMTYMNAAGERLLGRRREDVLGKTWHEAFPHAVGNPVDRMYQRVMRARRSERMEYQYAHYGAGRWFEISASPVATGGVAVYFRDISERKHAEEALRASEARKNAMFETALDCVISIDHEDRILDFNPAAERTFGFRRAEVLGRELAELIVPPRLRDRHRQGMARYLATGEPRVLDRRLEMPALRADGTEFPVELSVTRIPGEGPPLFTAYLRDITGRKHAEAALKEADRRKDEFLATLSHELRNPLAPLRNALHLAKLTGEGGSKARPLHDVMERQVSHLIRLVDDLLELSRITSGTFELRKEPVEVAALVGNALEMADPLIKAAGHRASVSLPREPLWVDGDAVRLAQILANLLNNAVKFSPGGGEILVSARREGARVAISVRDNGAGIAPEQVARMFDMFNKSERSSGLGIGLALSRKLAEMHGGTLEGRSDGTGKGAQFTVRLPLAKDQQPASSREESVAAVAPRKRVLVVDDNRDAAESLSLLLAHLGAEVKTAHDGSAALAAFESLRPEVVLLDLGMPGMDGYEVARRLKQRVSGEPLSLVALTGWGQDADRQRTREAGFDHHLVKPADIGALQALLGSLR